MRMARTAPCVVIGWDGATFDLLLPWARQGLLPNLAHMLETGSARRLRSVIPPVTPAAWVSIVTGMNPAKHGILDFKEFDANDYVPLMPVLINSTHFAGTTMLDLLSERGVRICSLQLPMTYPVWPINGLMLAGIPNPDDSKAYTYPPERAHEFEPLLPSLGRRQMSFEELYKHETFHIEKLTEIFSRMARENFDLYFVYFRECDDFHHLYWRLLDESQPGFDPAERSRHGNPILRIYQDLDRALGRILAALPEANFFLISDHGGTSLGRHRLYLNGWLEQQGYLKRQRTLRGMLERAVFHTVRLVKRFIPLRVQVNIQDTRPGLVRAWNRARYSTHAVNWQETRAFAVLLSFPTAGVQLNVRGRQRYGCVDSDADREQLRDELIEKLKALVHPTTGRLVVREAYRREEVFSGSYLDRLPDIVLELDPSVVVRAELSSRLWGEVPLSELHTVSGEHEMNGILVARGPAIRPAQFLPKATILDVAPSLLCALSQSVPENMDGHVLEDVFDPGFLAAHPPATAGSREVATPTGKNAFSPEEVEAIRTRLQALGYLED